MVTYQKLTLVYVSCHFSTIKLQLIFAMCFFDILRMFSIESSGNCFSKYMDKNLLSFYVYGDHKMVTNVSKIINTLFTCCVINALHV
jgi:hypothetical protein